MEQHELDQIVARLTDLRDKFSHIADTTPHENRKQFYNGKAAGIQSALLLLNGMWI